MTSEDHDPDAPANPSAGRRVSPLAGGAPLAALILVGVFVGGLLGQPSVGFLAGLGLGIAVAVGIAFLDRSRG